jgi:hypothetical protein
MANKHVISARIIAILGLVVGILSLLVSMIPCIGYYALVPSVMALICSIAGVIYLKKAGKSNSIAVIGILLGTLAVASSIYQYIEFKAVFDAKKRLENTVVEMEQEVKKEVKEKVIDYTKEKIDDYLNDDDTLKKPSKKSN